MCNEYDLFEVTGGQIHDKNILKKEDRKKKSFAIYNKGEVSLK